MLTYDMERRGELARYDYLCRCIREDILAGRLRRGEKLPSKRALAAHLQVAVVTVENAYAQLLAEGYLYAREKRGYFVSELESKPARELPPEEQEQEQEAVPWQLDLENSGNGIEGFPFSVWAKLMRRTLTDRGQQLLRATPHNGAAELRRAIASQLYRFRGITASPDQIVVGAGTEYLYNLLVQLLGRDKLYGVEDPGYSKAAAIYGLNGAACVPLSVDRQGVRREDVEKQGVQVLHLSPNHQFPTGLVMPIGRRQSLLNWAEQGADRYIIEDDYDSEFRFTGRPIPTLQSVDRGGRVIYMNTFSRTLASSLRISYMVLPQELMRAYRKGLGFYSCTVPAMEQYTLARFLEEGYFEAHVNRMRKRYRSHRDMVGAAIVSSAIGPRCQILRENAGLHFLVKLDTVTPDEVLKEGAEGLGIRLSLLSDFTKVQKEDSTHTLIIHYPCLDPEELRAGLSLLAPLL